MGDGAVMLVKHGGMREAYRWSLRRLLRMVGPEDRRTLLQRHPMSAVVE